MAIFRAEDLLDQKKESDDVSLVLATDGTGRVLLGRRRDNGRWTLPGGHLHAGEDPAQGLKRELLEEAGLVPVSLSFLRTVAADTGGRLHLYSALCYGTPHGRNDPDQEVDKWEWVDVRDGLPANVWDNLHGPAGDANVVRQSLELGKSERVWLDAGFAALEKMAVAHDDPKKPVVVWRVQNEEGEGPYAKHYPEARRAAVRNYLKKPASQPTPDDDFLPMEPTSIHYYGFAHPDHAKAWFGEKSLADLHDEGFRLTPVLADKVWSSDSGRQVLFRPYESDTAPFHDPLQPVDPAGHAPLPMRKSETDALLAHPDPRERALALKLASSTPADVSRAVLDPDPWVWRQALQHPFADYALATLASASRDAAGAPLFARHLEALRHPRLHPHHLEMMYRAARDDAALPAQLRADHLRALAAHEKFPVSAASVAHAAGLPVPEAFQKSLAAHKALAEATGPTGGVQASGEQPMPHLGGFAEAYHHHVSGPDATVQGSVPGIHEDDELDDFEGMSKKALYHVPVPGHEGPQRLMVKPYHEYQAPLAGWSEGTSQALYHAGGIGDLHQKSFVATHGTGEHMVPATVIHIEAAKPAYRITAAEARHPHVAAQAAKMGLMDFLMDQGDRHGDNVMMRPDNNLLAVDNAGGFTYDHSNHDVNYYIGLTSALNNLAAYTDYPAALQWWKKAGPDVRRAMEERLQLMGNADTREHVRKNFHARANYLDSLAHTPELPAGWMERRVLPFDEGV